MTTEYICIPNSNGQFENKVTCENAMTKEFNLPKTEDNDYLFDKQGLHNIFGSFSNHLAKKRKADWFNDYFGLKETDLWVELLTSDKIPSSTLETICESVDMTLISIFYNKNHIHVTNIKFTIKNILYNVGDFSCLPLEFLVNYQTKTQLKDLTERRITYDVIINDIVLLINNSNSTDVFQAASQFNLLEMTNETVSPEAGISDYPTYNSQGPRVAIASPIGTFFRNYLIDRVYSNEEFKGSPQTKNNQFNTLDLLLKYFKFIEVNTNPTQGQYLYKNGYCFINPTQEQSNQAQQNQHMFEHCVNVGVQWNSPLLIDYDKKVCQVYCSGLPFSGYARRYGLNLDSDGYEDRIKPFAVGILKVAFKCTLQVAVNKLDLLEDDSRINVYLTAVGDEEFRNPIEWVAEALIDALNDYKQYPLNVIMVAFGEVNPLLDYDAINKKIKQETTSKYKYLKYKHKYLELKNNNL